MDLLKFEELNHLEEISKVLKYKIKSVKHEFINYKEGPFLDFFINKLPNKIQICQNVHNNWMTLENYLVNYKYIHILDRLNLIIFLASGLLELEGLKMSHESLSNYTIFYHHETKQFKMAIGKLDTHQGYYHSHRDRLFLSKLMLRLFCDYTKVAANNRSL